MADTGALFVALPSSDDPINKVSEEIIAHCTLTYFGDAVDIPQVLQDGLQAAAEIVADEVGPFTVKVSGVALLGDDKASVVLLESQELVDLRGWLLAHPDVDMAIRGSKQFPTWVPHLTIRYSGGVLEDPPESISFDRLGLWLGETKETYDLHGNPFAAVSASALCIPQIACREDLSLGIRYGNQVPSAQWYIRKRAYALGAVELLPAHWGVS